PRRACQSSRRGPRSPHARARSSATRSWPAHPRLPGPGSSSLSSPTDPCKATETWFCARKNYTNFARRVHRLTFVAFLYTPVAARLSFSSRPMDQLTSHVEPNSEVFRANFQRMTALVAELKERLVGARQGGGARYLQRHREQGKMPVRERIDKLLDGGSPFL